MKEGLFVGMSSGAAMHIALRKSSELNEGIIVVILPDRGDRYLSTSLFTSSLCEMSSVNCCCFRTSHAENRPQINQ